ncbi:hypothetical protein F0365_08220 [Nonlabens sp. Ci31]|uniref:exopolysaccharide Pel transporter PelG n=1 Tax=Nonlabens sp. Ci31 TaxID=2608253 RepID=UPI001463AE02|nr:exopolysaccharide Pel transporter PelG [Nonlabens sp. Ci31]QJP34382.1 hypothetical protein F0365_08220 [Nonlabens sp. Ci31]
MSTQKTALEQLLEDIKERNGKPVNVLVVAASIESLGIRDVDAQTDYDYPSILDLANYIFQILDQKEYYQLKNEKQTNAGIKEYKRISINAYMTGRSLLFAKEYSTGLFHLLPVALQIFAIIFFGFSLWTYVGFNDLQSTAVVFGVIVGLVATGGFVQVIGKQVSFYWYSEDYSMAYASIKQIVLLGMKTMLLLFIVSVAINFFIHLYPFLFICIVYAYGFLIGLFLLALAPLYTIKQRWMISVSVFVATALALALHLTTAINTYLIHWLSISIGIFIAFSYLFIFFKKLIGSTKGVHNKAPKMLLAIYRNLDYFLYGVTIYSFIFMDRIIAWSSRSGRNFPYAIYYEPDYEIGMDLAILVFFFLAGVLEYSVSAFSRLMDYRQRTMIFDQVAQFNKSMLQLYFKNIKIFVGTAILIGVLLYFIITQPWGYEAGFDEQLSDLSIQVFIVGALGYLFLTLGMLNVLYFYTLNRHKEPLAAIFIATIVNLIIGLLLSRFFSYEYAVIGMLIGSMTFAALTTIKAIRYFKKLDYHFYASY